MFEVIDSTHERVYVIKFNNLVTDIRQFEESVNEFIETECRNMVVDMKEQEVMSSLLIGLLVRVNRGLSQRHRELVLKNCNPHAYRCMEMAGLESLFSFSNYLH